MKHFILFLFWRCFSFILQILHELHQMNCQKKDGYYSIFTSAHKWLSSCWNAHPHAIFGSKERFIWVKENIFDHEMTDLIVIVTSGTCFCPGISSKWNFRRINANMVFASSMAKFCPMQECDPIPNGSKTSEWRSVNRNGSNLCGSCQYFSELWKRKTPKRMRRFSYTDAERINSWRSLFLS